MQQWTTQFEWSFPLGITGIVIALLAAIALAILSYRYTPRTIGKSPQAVLIVLRLIFFMVLIFCLSRPTINRKRSITDPQKKSIAVLVDDSSSMVQETLSGTTRFEKSRIFWERNLKPHSDKYIFKLYQFGKSIRPVDEFTVQTPPSFTPTQLYRTISQWNEMFSAEGFDGVICMTDGVDTSGTSPDAAINSLMHTTLPHVFVPITTAVAGPPFAAFRKLEVKRIAKLNTKTPVTLVTATSGKVSKERMVLTVREDQEEIYRKEVPSSGSNIATRTHTFDLFIDRPGMHHYKAQISTGENVLAQTEWSVEGSTKDHLKVLLYQGGLDWGSRYFRSVFDRDTRSELTVAFAPNAFPARMVSEKNEIRFPSIEVLSAYDVVIILKMRREQIANDMEASLREFVSTGGSLLFIIANTLDAQSYIGSPLETFLPVEFESITDSNQYDNKTARFLDTMNAYRNSSRSSRSLLDSEETKLDAPPLSSFQLTEAGIRSPVFSYLKNTAAATKPLIPAFQDFALVRKGKPGARVLAVHPDFSQQNSKRILLAQQSFGEGQVAVLATDPLWRWKLTNHSADPSYDEFWKGFMVWLGGGRIHATYWDLPSKSIAPEIPVECVLSLSSRAGIQRSSLHAMITDLEMQKTSPLPLVVGNRNTRCTSTFTPVAGRTYRLRAFDGKKLLCESILSCPAASGHKELQELKSDMKVLHQLADASYRHELVQTDQPRDWNSWLPDQLDETDLVKTETHLWHKPWIFILMLILFLGELIIRRNYKLV